ncbi:MAG: glyceraldehyde-3-phosphate:ferredoxin oxidoreductase, partial [Candidatus Methanomethylicota archaeon]
MFVDVGRREFWVEEFDRGDLFGPVDWGLYCHLERFRSFEVPVDDGRNALCFGMGKLAWSELSGTRRMVFTFRSPLWGGFFLSTMGGACYVFRRVGVDFVAVVGKSDVPLVLMFKGKGDGGVEVRFEEVAFDKLVSVFKGFRGFVGFPAFARFIAEEFCGWFGSSPFSIAAVGPAAVFTNLGAIAVYASKSAVLDGAPISFAARGAPGSAMYRAHGVVGLVFGGDYVKAPRFPKADLSNVSVIDDVFNRLAGKRFADVAYHATTKYRFDPSTNSGGTFGNNYAYYDGLNPCFNWCSASWSSEERKRFFEEVINRHFVAPFNEEVIAKKSWRPCLEPCPAVCKKMYGEHKVDYEPYAASAANVGVLDFKAAVEVLSLVDAMGFDAIEFGNTAAWIFELLYRGLLKPEEL